MKKNLAPLLKNFAKSLDWEENIFRQFIQIPIVCSLEAARSQDYKESKHFKETTKENKKVRKSVAQKLWTAKTEFLNQTF